jgi:TonB family protein
MARLTQLRHTCAMNTSTRFLATVAAAAIGMVCQAPAQASDNGVPSVALTPLSSNKLAVSGAPGCNAAAAVDGFAYWEKPLITELEGIHGTASVKIDLTSSGALAGEQLYDSSGNTFLDQAALKSARMTKFTPERVNCASVSGSYLYEVEF